MMLPIFYDSHYPLNEKEIFVRLNNEKYHRCRCGLYIDSQKNIIMVDNLGIPAIFITPILYSCLLCDWQNSTLYNRMVIRKISITELEPIFCDIYHIEYHIHRERFLFSKKKEK